MNDSQIVDLLRALGLGLLAVDFIVDLIGAIVGVPGVTGYAGPALALLVASLVFDATRRLRTRSALKRLKQQLGDKQAQARTIVLGGDK